MSVERIISPTEELRQEHVVALELLEELGAVMQEPASAIDLDALWQFLNQLLHFFFSEARLHQWKEEEVLFPVYEAISGRSSNLIRRMRAEHSEVNDKVLELRSLVQVLEDSDNQAVMPHLPRLQEIANQVRLDLSRHMETENEVLFPQAERAFSDEELKAIGINMQQIGPS